MDIYDTENSRYEIDLPAKRYRRTPLTGPDFDARLTARILSDRLAYGEWLPLKDIPNPVTIVCDDFNPYRAPEMMSRCLHIMHESSTKGILTSPITFMALDVEAAE